jgi:hypothetical protein
LLVDHVSELELRLALYDILIASQNVDGLPGQLPHDFGDPTAKGHRRSHIFQQKSAMQVSVAEIRVADDRIGPSHLALVAVDLDDVFIFELEFFKSGVW